MTVSQPGARAAARRPARGAWFQVLAGGLTAAVFLYLTLRSIPWPAMRESWRAVAPAYIALALVALASGWTVRIVRWWLMLRTFEPALPLGDCTRSFLASFAVNNTMPLRAGDVLRVFSFRGAARLPAPRVIGTMVIERVLDVAVLLALFFAGLFGVVRAAVPPAFVAAGTAVFVTCLAAILTFVLAPRAVEGLVGRLLLGPLARWRLASRLHTASGQFFGTFGEVLTLRRALRLLALSLVGWALEGAVYAAVASALHSGAAPFGPWFALATGTLATLLPSSPGHVGTFDYFASLGLVAYGATRAAGAAFALLTHFLLWLSSTAVGALALLAMHRASRAARPRAQPAATS